MDESILIHCVLRKDAQYTQDILTRHNFRAVSYLSMKDLANTLDEDSVAVVLTSESLQSPGVEVLFEKLETQPAWSAVPIIVLTAGEEISRANLPILQRLEAQQTVSFLDRPVRIKTLVSAVRAAYQARIRQYQVRDLLLQLEQAVANRDEFLAMLGHELRNPLAPIQNATELLSLSGQPLTGEQQWAFDMIRRQTGQLIRLVDDLLDVARITRGKVNLQRAPVTIDEIIRQAAEQIMPLTKQRGQALLITAPDTPLTVNGDTARLAQALGNLLQNAAKYSDKGSRIWLQAEQENDQVTIRVRDEGIGIPPENVESVFNLFSQGERSLDRSLGGLGIGLTVVRKLVEMHGGTVHAFSEGPGKGSEFTLRLPLAAGNQQAKESVTNDSPTHATRHILVVDDNPDVANSFAKILELLGHRVSISYKGSNALQRAAEDPPDVIFLDLGMPGLNGFEIARRLRRLDMEQRPVLVAMTGYAQAEDIRQARAAGFDHHLRKPVDMAQVQEIIANFSGLQSPQGPGPLVGRPLKPREE
ncbi:ATP-binding protein [Nitrosococcus wardiae]|uniref:histidine kinase n=1 Tax=Nitrosococcus wardiae TaxID=1814290 RepID=A0A4P7C1K7_9GAMM|nr:ATP-binding protein [Nitrosococcus wardiae]QBQ54762.1 response regulator [Nitrosococcus wardiae]